MTSRQRMITAMLNKQPDYVPVAPDISNMIPARMTGKPFWDIYLHRDPPLWHAYIDAVKHFGFDGWLPVYCSHLDFAGENDFIVFEDHERIVTRHVERVNGQALWSPNVMVYPIRNPPTYLAAWKIGMGDKPDDYRPIENKPSFEDDIEVFYKAKQLMGEDGVVGLNVWIPLIGTEEAVYRYCDEDESLRAEIKAIADAVEGQTKRILLEKPDFVFIGYSGGLTLQTPEMFRNVALDSVKMITLLAKEAGIPSQMHCCGRSRALVEIVANETEMSNINPLEVPPMGDCNLAEIKRSFGKKISLMGNLHTSEVMLQGSPSLVREKAKQAIDDAGEGGGFILSTGDQCGRDTPDENIFAMIDVARTYGKY